MEKAQYGLKKAEKREILPEINLIDAPHRGNLTHFALFGRNTYQNNVEAMNKAYFHSKKLPNITFRPATSSETISAVAYEFGEGKEFDAKRDILSPSWVQMRHVQTKDGIYTNIESTDESYLKKLVDNSQKVNGIYLINGNVAFIPYESFEQGILESGKFAEGGLARGLEHTDKKVAENLKKINSFYSEGVRVRFDSVSEPVKQVSALGGDWGGGWRSGVFGDDWFLGDDGHAFGVQAAKQLE